MDSYDLHIKLVSKTCCIVFTFNNSLLRFILTFYYRLIHLKPHLLIA